MTYHAKVTTYYASRVSPVSVAVSFNRDTSEDSVEGAFSGKSAIRSGSTIFAYFLNPERLQRIKVYGLGKWKVSNIHFSADGIVVSFKSTKTARKKRAV